MTLLVREAVDDDAAAVASLYVEASIAALGSSANREAIDAAAAGAHAMWRPLRRPEPGQWLLVGAVSAHHTVGFASFGVVDGDVGHLYALYVSPEVWSTGVGGRLLTAALQRLQDASVMTVELWVQKENERARRFYGRRGWEYTGDERSNQRGTFLQLAFDLGGDRRRPDDRQRPRM